MIKLYDKRRYHCKQSQNEDMPKLPIRCCCLAPSAGGKTTAIQHMILNPQMYRGCFERFYICSPSIHLDATWIPVKTYIKEKTGLEPFYDEFDEESLTEFVKHHEKVVEQQKRAGSHKLFGVLIVLDDLAATSVMRNPRGIIAHLAVRGRHSCASLILSSQSYKAIHPLIRTQLNLLLLWCQFQQKEFQSLQDEVSAVAHPDRFKEMFEEALREPYSFLIIDFQKFRDHPEQAFKVRFERPLNINRIQ